MKEVPVLEINNCQKVSSRHFQAIGEFTDNADFEIDEFPASCPFSAVDFETRRGEVFKYAKSHPDMRISVENACRLLNASIDQFRAWQTGINIFPTVDHIQTWRVNGFKPLKEMAQSQPGDEITFKYVTEGYEMLILIKRHEQRQREQLQRNAESWVMSQFRMDKQYERENFERLEDNFARFLKRHCTQWGLKFSGCTITRPNGEKVKIGAINPERKEIRYALGDACTYKGKTLIAR